MKLKQKFSEADLQRIKAAVKDAENNISGEIVPVIVEKSGFYTVANYKGSLFGATLLFVVMIILDRYVIDASNTLFYDPVFIFFVVVLGGIIGALLPNFSPFIRRKLIDQVHMDRATRQRAENAFLEEEVFNTRHRTGIMIFISFFEHEVIVMADRGISKVVEQKQWDKIVSDLVLNIRDGKIVEGIEAGIRRCGEILLEKGFHKTSDDINELRDDLRIS
ncbi:MAG: TPM domain-containing protein [Bacteroidota bacterium]